MTDLPDKAFPDNSDKDTLDRDIGSPGQNSRMHATTKIQSVVSPERYPLADRKTQTEVASGKQSEEKDGPEGRVKALIRQCF